MFATMTKTQTANGDGRTARRVNHTNLKIVDEGDCYKATEPASENETYGRGQSRAEAAMNYCALFVEDEQ